MPRYFFTIQASNGDLEDDRISEALPDITAALAHAERMIRELQKEGGYDDPGLKMFVKDSLSRQSYFCRSLHAAIRVRTYKLKPTRRCPD